MPTNDKDEKREDSDADFLLGELVGWIGRGLWAVIAGIVAAVTD